MAGLAAAVIAYGVHCLYDWDWNIPALSLPAFLFLGVLAARRGPALAGRTSSAGLFTRVLCLAAATLWLCAFAVSAELPQLAASRASAALVVGSRHSQASLRAAQADATSSSRLDPLSDAGLLAQATLALRVHDLRASEHYLREAVARDPSDTQAWWLLGLVDGAIGQPSQAHVAAQRAIDLDPMGHYAQAVAAKQLAHSPPSSSATRYP